MSGFVNPADVIAAFEQHTGKHITIVFRNGTQHTVEVPPGSVHEFMRHLKEGKPFDYTEVK